MIGVAQVLDSVLEVPIVPSFTRVGFEARQRLFHWSDLDDYGEWICFALHIIAI